VASIDLAQPIQVGHILGLFRYASGIFAAWLWLASFRTNVIVVVSLGLLPLLRRALRGFVQALGAPRLAIGQALTWPRLLNGVTLWVATRKRSTGA